MFQVYRFEWAKANLGFVKIGYGLHRELDLDHIIQQAYKYGPRPAPDCH